jgi:HK97 family phage major capsid protein
MNRKITLSLAALGTLLCFGLYGMADVTLMGAVSTLVYAVSPYLGTAAATGFVTCDDPVETLTKELGEAVAKLTKQQTELKEAHSTVMNTIEKGAKLDPEVQGNIDKAIAKANESSENVNALATKLDDVQKAIKEAADKRPMSQRQYMIKELQAEGVNKSLLTIKERGGSVRVAFKEIVSGGDEPSFSTGLRREPFIDSMVSMERPPLRIMDLITTIPVQTDAVKYGKQVLRDNKAAIVAEGDQKPYSNYKWEDATAGIEVLAHLAKMTLQALADAPRLAAEIESEMRFGLAAAKEYEVLRGPGGEGRFNGIWNQATTFTMPVGVEAGNVLTSVDRLRVAMLNLHLQYAVPDAHVLNPIDLANIDLLRRDPDKGGGYLFGSPDGSSTVTRLWRLPVIETPAMNVGDFLTGAFKWAVHYYQREGVSVLISTENDDDFERNKATMRVEERGGVAVRRPWAIQKGQLAGGGGS